MAASCFLAAVDYFIISLIFISPTISVAVNMIKGGTVLKIGLCYGLRSESNPSVEFQRPNKHLCSLGSGGGEGGT